MNTFVYVFYQCEDLRVAPKKKLDKLLSTVYLKNDPDYKMYTRKLCAKKFDHAFFNKIKGHLKKKLKCFIQREMCLCLFYFQQR